MKKQINDFLKKAASGFPAGLATLNETKAFKWLANLQFDTTSYEKAMDAAYNVLKEGHIFLTVLLPIFAVHLNTHAADISKNIERSIKEFSPLLPNAKKDVNSLSFVATEFCKITVAALHHGDIKSASGPGNSNAVSASEKECKTDLNDAKILFKDMPAQESTIRAAHLGCNIGANLWIKHPNTKMKIRSKILEMPKEKREDAFDDAAELISSKLCPEILREFTKKK